MINFAHGEVFMSGTFTAYFLAIYLDSTGFWNQHPIISILLVLALATVVSVTIAVVLERIAYRPLRGAPRLVPLITAIGASFFLQYTFRRSLWFGRQDLSRYRCAEGHLDHFWIRDPQDSSCGNCCSSHFHDWLRLYVQKTKAGRAMRAVAEDKEAAALMGINVDRVIVNTFALGGASAAAAGIMYALIFKQVNAFMGFIPGIKAFTAAVLGGIGSLPGAFVGGLFLGIVESIGPSLVLDGLGIPAPYQLKDAIAFLMLVLVLIFRPSVSWARICRRRRPKGDMNMTQDKKFTWQDALKLGLIGGVLELFVCLVGMVAGL